MSNQCSTTIYKAEDAQDSLTQDRIAGTINFVPNALDTS